MSTAASQAAAVAQLRRLVDAARARRARLIPIPVDVAAAVVDAIDALRPDAFASLADTLRDRAPSPPGGRTRP